MTEDRRDKEASSYIPNYIISKPWYKQSDNDDFNSDPLAHQRKNGEIIDFSLPEAGKGIRDNVDEKGNKRARNDENYDSKRDRWYGYDISEWDKVLNEWDTIKRSTSQSKENQDDSDDTDYGLELMELGIDPSKFNKTNKITMDKLVRERLDVPSYIKNITTSQKIHRSAVINSDKEFVKSHNELQKFAWEENQAYVETQKEKVLQSKLEGSDALNDIQVPESDLNSSVEANPTSMYLRHEEKKKEEKENRKIKRRNLLQKYVSVPSEKDKESSE